MATPKKKAKVASKAKAKPTKKATPKAKPAPKAKAKVKPAAKKEVKKAKPVKAVKVKPAKVKPAKVVPATNGVAKKPAATNGTIKSLSTSEIHSSAFNSDNYSVRNAPPPQTKLKTRPTDGRTRYTDVELAEFKQLIDEKMEAAKVELKYLQDQINRKDDNGTDDTENKFANMEDGSATLEREYLTQMAARQLQYIDHLEKALIRIQNKTYGICRVTGKLIEKERLRAVPHATLSMEAKMSQNKA
jgi:RNA polymerase-binding transcription factor DksA